MPTTTHADAVITKIGGEWHIRLRSTNKAAVVQSQSGTTTTQDVINVTFRDCSHQQLTMEEEDDYYYSKEVRRRRWFKEMRTGWLMVLATLTASTSYQASLNPPGGFWQDSPADGSHRAGDPVLGDEQRSRYLTFYYFNATAFVASLMIMMIAVSERFYYSEPKVVFLMFTTFVDLVCIIGAYIAGSTRNFSAGIYVMVIACLAFFLLIYLGEMWPGICIFFLVQFPCTETLASKKWCPIPAPLLDIAMEKKREKEHRKAQRKQHDDA